MKNSLSASVVFAVFLHHSLRSNCSANASFIASQSRFLQTRGIRRNPASITTVSGKRGGRGNKESKKARVSKKDLPSKICVVCDRPFTWRKKWERCWDEVTCCSKSCNAKRRSG